MLFMILVKASHNSEGLAIRQAHLEEKMDEYNQKLIDAKIRVMAKGLHPSSEGIRFSYRKENESPLMSFGPFEPVNELIAGFFLIEVKSKEEAIVWASQCPDPMGFGEGQIELRQVFE